MRSLAHVANVFALAVVLAEGLRLQAEDAAEEQMQASFGGAPFGAQLDQKCGEKLRSLIGEFRPDNLLMVGAIKDLYRSGKETRTINRTGTAELLQSFVDVAKQSDRSHVSEHSTILDLDLAAMRSKGDDSFDMSVFYHGLHHANEATIPLIMEAARVTKKYIVIAEDLKDENRRSWQASFADDNAAIYRADVEWRALFRLMKLEVVREFEPSCATWKSPITRKTYVLQRAPEFQYRDLLVPGLELSATMKSSLSREPEDPSLEKPKGTYYEKAGLAGLGSNTKLNHGSPQECNIKFSHWIENATWSSNQLHVLDVGGGKGELKNGIDLSHTDLDLQWECIDVVESEACKAYGGANLEEWADKSKDAVVFNYVLHHASGNTIHLLEEAARVTKNRIIIQEDMWQDHQGNFLLYRHDAHGTFRTHDEWKMLFALLGFSVELEQPVNCMRKQGLGWPRTLWVLHP